MLRYLAYGSKHFPSSPVEPMTRFNWEFYANLRGSLRPTLSSTEKLPLETAPTLWLFAPEVVHGWDSKTRVERIVFHFSSVPDVIREACGNAGHISAKLEPHDVELLRQIGEELLQHYRSPTPASLLMFERALIDLSLIFLRGRDFAAALPLETVAVERVQRAIEWYLSHLHQRPTLDALADAVHISTPHLRRHFRLVYGKSPHLVLTNLRLEKAAQLLATTDHTLEVISRSSGFNSSSDFCRVFKQRFGVYPNEWRMQVGKKETPLNQVMRSVARRESMEPGAHIEKVIGEPDSRFAKHEAPPAESPPATTPPTTAAKPVKPPKPAPGRVVKKPPV